MATLDQLVVKASVEERHTRERAKIEVEPIAICTERSGEDMASEADLWG